MITQDEKGRHFHFLHERRGTFVIPNPWDAGSARVFEALGFEALATTSSGFANTMGRMDGEVTLFEALDHCRAVCDVTGVPVSADFENGFADDPETLATNVLLLSETGVAGCSIEDYGDGRIYEFMLAVERVEAAVEAVRALAFPFVLTARAENLIRGVQDLDDTIRRLQAFEAAGAEVLYAPGLHTPEQVRIVLDAVEKPINVLAAVMPDVPLSEYEQLGVKRVSIGGGAARYALTAAVEAGKQMQGGRFDFMKTLVPNRDVAGYFSPR